MSSNVEGALYQGISVNPSAPVNEAQDSKLVEFKPLPIDMPQSYGSAFKSYFKKITGNFSRSSKEMSMSYCSPSNDSPISPSPEDEFEIIQPSESDIAAAASYPFPTERNIEATLKRIEYVLLNEGFAIEQRRDHWATDTSATSCRKCEERFYAFRRRHHCRLCGYIFCSACCNVRLPMELVPRAYEPVRVCEHCHSTTILIHKGIFGSTHQNTDRNSGGLMTDSRASGFDGTSYHPPLDRSENCARKPAMGFVEENYASRVRHWSAEDNVSITGLFSDEMPLDGPNTTLTQLKAIHHHSIHGPHRLPGSTHRYRFKIYYSCFLASDLVNWLLTNKYAASRSEAVGICNALLQSDLISCVLGTEDSDQFTDGAVPYRLNHLNSSKPTFVSHRENEGDTQALTSLDDAIDSAKHSSSSTEVEVKEEVVTKTQEEPPLMTHDSSVGDSVPQVSKADITNRLDSVWDSHVEKVMSQVLQWCEVGDDWAPTLWPIIQRVARTVSPDVRNMDDFMDVRRFLRFKKLPGGRREECEAIDGIVFTKTVACRGMSTRLSDPKLLLLGDQPALFPSWHLESIRNGRQREKESMQEVVTRVLSQRPHVVLTEGSLSYPIQQKLQSHGLTLVLGVKKEVLSSIARVTQGSVINNLITKTSLPELGFCHSFFTKTYELPITSLAEMDKLRHASVSYSSNRGIVSNKETLMDSTATKVYKKHLMFFSGCPAHLGCTILLRGGTADELKKVKDVVKFMVFVLYNWRFERSYLIQERAYITSRVSDGLAGIEGDDAEEERSVTPVISRREELNSPVSEVIEDNSDPLRSEQNDTSTTSATELIVDNCMDNSNVFKQALNDAVISSSPYVRKNLPFLETDDGKISYLRKYFPDALYHSKFLDYNQLSRGKSQQNSSPGEDEIPETVVQNLDKDNLTLKVAARHSVLDSNLSSKDPQCMAVAVSDYRAHGAQLVLLGSCESYSNRDDNESIWCWNVTEGCCSRGCGEELTMPWSISSYEAKASSSLQNIVTPTVNRSFIGQYKETDKMDAFHIANHQLLSVLYSCQGTDTDTNSYCVKPLSLVLEYYGGNDSPLGGFLTTYYFSQDYNCPRSSKDKPCKAEHHVRKFYHGGACVQIRGYKVHKDWYPSTRGKNVSKEDLHNISMWNWCTTCRTSSSTEIMSPITWSFSLAKYLEIWFYGGGTVSRKRTKSGTFNTQWQGASLKSNHCPHNLHQTQHHQYFYYKERLAVVQYTPAAVRGMILPPIPLQISPVTPTKQEVLDRIRNIADKGYSVFDNILERIPKEDTAVNEYFKRQRARFKRLYDSVQLDLTSHKVLGGQLQSTKPKSELDQPTSILPKTMLSVKDNIVLLHRIVVESLNFWNLKYCKKDEGPINDETAAIDIIPTNTSPNLQSHSHEGRMDYNMIKSDLKNELIRKEKRKSKQDVDLSSEQSSSKENKITMIEEALDSLCAAIKSSEERRKSRTEDEKLFTHSDGKLSVDNIVVQTEDSYSRSDRSDLTNESSSADAAESIPESSSNEVSHNEQHVETADEALETLAEDNTAPLLSNDSKISASSGTGNGSTAKMSDFRARITGFLLSSSSNELKYPFNPSCHYQGLEELAIPVMVHRDQLSSIIAHAIASKQYYIKLREKMKLYLDNEREPDSISSSIPSTHINLTWRDHGSFNVLVYFSAEFHLLRKTVFGEKSDEMFIRSLSSSVDWLTKGGKSKSAFHKTTDDRFVLKEMKSIEQEPVDQFCPAYFKHLWQCHHNKRPTALARIFGIFSVGYSKRTKVLTGNTGSQQQQTDSSSAPQTKSHTSGNKIFMIMENLFYGHNISKIYDLKGNSSNRTTKEGPNNEPGEVFLDNNLKSHRVTDPLLVNHSSASVLSRAIEVDTLFLEQCKNMDYSLLVGVTEDYNSESGIVLGIIDYVRKFTPDKYLENLVKENLLRTENPTIVSPEEYMKRFKMNIPLYFDCVPDGWSHLENRS